MTEPSLALQTAVRTRLIASPHVMELVDADEIRDGVPRPESYPTIILGNAQVQTAGHYGTYRNVTVYLDLHIWGNDLEAAKRIGGAVAKALGNELSVPGYDLTDGLRTDSYIYMRDSSGCGHGVVSLRALTGSFL